MRPLAALCCSLAMLIMLAACDDDNGNPTCTPLENPDGITNVQYTQDVQALLNAYCVSCHGSGRQEAGLRLDSWAGLVAGSAAATVIVPHAAQQSLLIQLLKSSDDAVHAFKSGDCEIGSSEIALLERWIDAGARNDQGQKPYADADQLLYVCNQNAAGVSIIDMERNRKVGYVDLTKHGFNISAKPHHVAVEPDGSAWYLSLIGGNAVLKFNNANEIIGRFDLAIPALLSLDAARNLLYVSRFMDMNQPFSSVAILDSETMQAAAGTEEGEVPVQFHIPHAMANNGSAAFSASMPASRLIRIDATNFAVSFTPMPAGAQPLQMAIAPGGGELWLSAQGVGKLYIFDISSAEPQLVDSVQSGDKPWHPVFSPDGARLYVGNHGSNTVSVIDVATRQVERTISNNSLAGPHGSAIRADGQYLYISSRNQDGAYTPRYNLGPNTKTATVTVINTATAAVEAVIEVPEFASGIGR